MDWINYIIICIPVRYTCRQHGVFSGHLLERVCCNICRVLIYSGFTLKFSPLIENPKSWNLKEHLGAGMNKAAPGSLRSSSNIKEKKGQVSLRRRRRRLVLWSHPSCPCHPCRYSKIKLQEGGSHPTHDSLLQWHSPVLVANIISWHIFSLKNIEII